MKHIMRLQAAPFAMIRSGQKTIELRLCDEKRQRIAVGDQIEFLHAQTGESLLCVVIALHRFVSFRELYKHLPLLQCGYTEEDVGSANPVDMDVYYSPAEQARYGVLGIKIRLQ